MNEIIDLIVNGNLNQALLKLNKIIKKDKKNGELYYNKALIYHKLDDNVNAKTYFEKAISLNFKNKNLYEQLLLIYEQLSEKDNILKCLKELSKISPSWQIYANMASIQKDKELYIESIENYNRAIELNQNNHLLHFNLGGAFYQLKDFKKAQIEYDKTLHIKPDFLQAKHQKVLVYISEGEYNIAMKYCLQLYKENPKVPYIVHNLAQLNSDLMNLDQAIILYKEVLEIEPINEKAKFDLSLVYLLKQEFDIGWSLYTYRKFDITIPERLNAKKIKTFYEKVLSAPKFTNKKEGQKTLYVLSEQGFGDTIMFSPFLKKVSSDFNIIFEVHKNLVKLITKSLNNTTNIKVIEKFKHTNIKFDYSIKLLDLVALFVNDKKNAYIEQYLKVDDKPINNIANQLKVGFSFKGSPRHTNDHNRSISLEKFLKNLIDYEAYQYYCLERDLSKPQIEILQNNSIEMPIKDCNDFYESATFINQLDLIITVDTAVAHVSASLGKKTLILLPFSPDWRWADKGEKSYWYGEHVTLFRQDSFNNWDNVFKNIKNHLNNEI